MRRLTRAPAKQARRRARAVAGSAPPRLPRWRRRLAAWPLRLAAAVLTLGLVLGLAGKGTLTAAQSAWAGRQAEWAAAFAFDLTRLAGLALDDVTVVGRRHVPREALFLALGVERGQPTLAIDAAEVKARLERLPWVRRARVEKRLPGRLLVVLEEHEPIAIWQSAGHYALVDRSGATIAERHLERYRHLPVLTGAEAPMHAAALMDLLASEPRLALRVAGAMRVAGRRWNLFLDNGVEVRLPEVDPAAAWHELARLAARHGLLQRDLRAIDLRLPDRVTVRLAPGAAARLRRPSDDT